MSDDMSDDEVQAQLAVLLARREARNARLKFTRADISEADVQNLIIERDGLRSDNQRLRARNQDLFLVLERIADELMLVLPGRVVDRTEDVE